jgi:hypothetical protein
MYTRKQQLSQYWREDFQYFCLLKFWFGLFFLFLYFDAKIIIVFVRICDLFHLFYSLFYCYCFRGRILNFWLLICLIYFYFLLFLFSNTWPDAWEREQICYFPSHACQCIYPTALDVIKIIVSWKNRILQLFQNKSRRSLIIKITKHLNLMNKNECRTEVKNIAVTCSLIFQCFSLPISKTFTVNDIHLFL